MAHPNLSGCQNMVVQLLVLISNIWKTSPSVAKTQTDRVVVSCFYKLITVALFASSNTASTAGGETDPKTTDEVHDTKYKLQQCVKSSIKLSHLIPSYRGALYWSLDFLKAAGQRVTSSSFSSPLGLRLTSSWQLKLERFVHGNTIHHHIGCVHRLVAISD